MPVVIINVLVSGVLGNVSQPILLARLQILMWVESVSVPEDKGGLL